MVLLLPFLLFVHQSRGVVIWSLPNLVFLDQVLLVIALVIVGTILFQHSCRTNLRLIFSSFVLLLCGFRLLKVVFL
jgi:hypothetical protein